VKFELGDAWYQQVLRPPWSPTANASQLRHRYYERKLAEERSNVKTNIWALHHTLGLISRLDLGELLQASSPRGQLLGTGA